MSWKQWIGRRAGATMCLWMFAWAGCSPEDHGPSRAVAAIRSGALVTNGSFSNGLNGWTVTAYHNAGIATLPPTNAFSLGLLSASSTLQVALTANATIINVASISSFNPGTSMLQIDSEIMTYSGTGNSNGACSNAPPCLTGASRGQFGTTASSHNLGAKVTAPTNSFARTGAIQSQKFSSLSAGPPFYPEFGGASAVINESPLGFDHTANSIKQAYTTTNGDVDPSDNKVHLRFALAPALQNPGHQNSEQPYFFVEVRNKTQGTVVFDDFNFSNQPGLVWKVDSSGTTPVAYTDWQLYDVSPGNGAIAPGDTLEVEVYASGCARGGHWGEVYVEGFGEALPGLSVRASGPQQANLDSDITYNFSIQNSAVLTSRNVIVDETLPRHSTFVSINPGSGTCTSPAVGATGSVSCNFGTLNPAENRTFSVTVHNNAPSVSSKATAATANSLSDTTQSFAANQYQGYSVLLRGGPGVGQQGVVLTNIATNVSVAPNWAAQPTSATTYYVLNTPDLIGTVSAGGGSTLTDASQNFGVNQWVGYTVTLLTGTGAGQQNTILANNATQLSLNSAWTTPPANGTKYAITYPLGTLVNGNYGVRSDTASRLVGPAVKTTVTTGIVYTDVSITNSDGVAAVAPNSTAVYTVRVTNNGPAAVTNAVVNDTFPAGLSAVTWTCSGAAGGSCGSASGSGNIANAQVSLPVGATATFTASATVSASVGSTITNTATVATPPGATDSDTSNNSDTSINSVNTLFNLTVNKDNTNSGLGSVASSPASISCGTGCNTQTASFASGTNVVLTAVARAGDTFVGWTGACTGNSSTCTVAVNADTTVGLQFRGPAVTGTSGGNGTVSCSPSPVTQGSNSTCTLTPNTGYAFLKLTDNGTDVTTSVSGNSYALSALVSDHAVNASFNAIPVITSTVSPTQVASGSSHTYNATATDSDGPTPLTWSLGLADTCGGTVNASTGVYSYTAGSSSASCALSVKVCDAASLPACSTQTTPVQINRPPVITSTAPTNATQAVAYVYNAIATDPNGQSLAWSTGPGNTCGGTVNAVTGQYSFTPPGTNACVVSVRVCNSGTPQQCANQQTSLTPSQCQFSIATGSPQSVAVRLSFSPLGVLVQDALGNPLQGIAVTFGAPSSGASATLASGSAPTDTSGKAQVGATANAIVGSYSVSAGASCASSPVQFSLTNHAGPPASLTLTGGNLQSTSVTTAYSQALSVSVVDADGNPVPGASVTFAAPASGPSASLSAPIVVTNNAGVASTSAIANTASGALNIVASVGGSVSPLTFSLTNLPGTAVSLKPVSGNYQSTLVNTTFPVPLVVSALDAYGNPVPGAAVTFTGPPSSAPSAVLSPSGAVNSDANGQVSVGAKADGVAGTFLVTARLSGGQQAGLTLTNTRTAPISVTAVAGGGQTTPVGTAFAAPLVARVTQAGVPVSGIQVTFLVPAVSPTSVLSTSTAVTDANGYAQVTGTAGTSSGAYAVTAVAPGAQGPVSFAESNLPGPVAVLRLNPGSSPQTAQAGTAFAAPISVTAVDVYGNPVPGVSVTLTPPQSGGVTVTLSQTTVSSDSSGVVSVTSTAGAVPGSGTVNISAPGVSPLTMAFTVSSSVPYVLVVSSGSPQSATVGSNFGNPLVVRVVDGNGVPVSGATVTWNGPSSGTGASASLSPLSGPSGVNGSMQVTAQANTVAGRYKIFVTVSGGAAPVAFDLTNLAGAPATLTVDPLTSQQTTIVGTSFPLPLQAQVTDAFGNPVSGVTVSFTFNDPTAALANVAATTDANGQVSVAALAGAATGAYAVTASVPGLPPVTFNLKNAPVQPPTLSVAAGAGQSTPATTSFPIPLLLVVRNGDGTPLQGVSVALALPASGPSATAATTTLSSDVNGEVAFNLTANDQLGNFALTAAASGVATPAAASLTVTAIPTTTTLTTSPTNPSVDGPLTLQAQVTSAHGVPPGTVQFFAENSVLGSAVLSNGTASLTVPGMQLTVGTHLFHARYVPTNPYGASDSGDSSNGALGVGNDRGRLNGGGGCSASGPQSAATGVLLVVCVALFLIRRRGENARVLRVAVATLLFISSAASAQSSPGASVEAYHPSPAGSDWLGADSLNFGGNGRLAVRALFDYARNPLVSYNADGSQRSLVLSHQLWLDAGVSLVFLDRFRVSLDVPLALHQGTQPSFFDGLRVDPAHAGGLGDVSLSADVLLAGRPRGPAKFAVGATVLFPTGSQSAYLGDGALGVYPHARGAGQVGHFAWATEIGAAYRHGDRIADVNFGAEGRARAAAGALFLDDHLLIGPEIDGFKDLGRSAGAARPTGLEGALVARIQFLSDWAFHLGAGTGLRRSPGIPAWRALASIEWAPPAPSDDAQTERRPNAPPPDPVAPKVAAVSQELDSDGDGIPDRLDLCPTVPAGVHPDSAKMGCPEADSDGDGILDSADKCPTVSAGPHPDPAKRGCPTLDQDGDGVPDVVDVCPNEPGLPEFQGCPKKQRVSMSADKLTIVEAVYFKHDKAIIERRSLELLREVARVILSHPNIPLIRVEGHTDSHGNRAHNTELSERRAESVVKYLVAQGVPQQRLQARGYGPERPIASNETTKGRGANRRVEFVIVEASSDGL